MISLSGLLAAKIVFFFFCLFLYLEKLDGLAVVWLFFSVQSVAI